MFKMLVEVEADNVMWLWPWWNQKS